MEFSHFMKPDGIRVMAFNVEEFAPQNVTAIKSGSYLPALILNRLPQDNQLIVKFLPWNALEELDLDNPNQVFWADASGVTFMKINGSQFQGWLSPFLALGLKVRNTPKLAKRLKEVVRITKFWDNRDLAIKWFTTTEDTEMHFDGINVISMRHAVNMARNIEDFLQRKRAIKAIKSGKIVRVNYRHLSPMGLVKGDAIIIPDRQMIKEHGKLYDLVAPDVNLKDDIATTDWSFTTMNPHHAHNQAMFDVQSASWLREWLFPRKQMMDTLTSVIDNALEQLREGEWPAWMIMPEEETHGDVDLNVRYMERASEAFRLQYIRWQLFGMNLESSASLLGMAANGFKSKLYSRLNNRNAQGKWKPKLWFPLNHAVYGHVVTHEVLRLAGYSIPVDCEDKLFFHEDSHSFSLPGDQFAESFERHGTWDLDDSAKFFLRKVKDEDRIVGIIVRSPNSDGEYSIHEVGNIEDFPLYHNTYSEMPEVDLTKAPKFIEDVQAQQKVAGLTPDPRVAGSEFSLDEATYMIDVQADNPGVGSVANAMMVYYATFGASPAAVCDSMGNIVDCVQQTPYTEGFQDINKFTESLWDQLIANGKVDKFMLWSRVPGNIAEGFSSYDGYFTKLYNHLKSEAERYSEESRTIAFSTRQVNIINGIEDITFAPGELTKAARWVEHAEGRFQLVQRNNRGDTREAARRRSLGNQEIIRDMVAKLMTLSESERYRRTLAMYRYCVMPGAEAARRFGVSDRCLFAPAGDGNQSVLDIFLEALVDAGMARIPEFMESVSKEDMMAEVLAFAYDMLLD